MGKKKDSWPQYLCNIFIPWKLIYPIKYFSSLLQRSVLKIAKQNAKKITE